MDSSDSTDENVTKSYDRNRASLREAPFSSMAKASSESRDTEEISKPTSSKGRKKKISRDENKNSISTTSQPSSLSKRSRESEAEEGTKSSSKKMKKSAEEDDKGNATTVSGAEKSPRKRGLSWTPEDEVAYLKGLVAFCEKGKFKNLPPKMGLFFEGVRKDLDVQYSPDQLYNKLQWFEAKYFRAKDKMKTKGFVRFNNAHEEAVYMFSKQVWGKGEEKKVGSEKMKEGSTRGKEKKKPVGEREEVDSSKEMAVVEQEAEEKEEEGDDEEEEEEEHAKSEQKQNDNLDVKQRDPPLVSESVRNKVAGMEDTEKSEESGGEEMDYSKENGGEEESSEKNEGEEEDSSQESEETENESSGKENSAQPDSNSALIQSNAIENFVGHVMNGGRGHYNAGDNSRFEKLTYEILNMTLGNLQGSNTVRHINLDMSMRSSFEKELPALSNEEAEMLDRKWQTQHLIGLEALSKRVALLQEEYQLRLAKLRHRLGQASP